MADPIEIDLWQGEIAELEVDAIVVPATESLFMTTAVGRAVKLRGGEAVEREAVDQGPVASGSAVVTGAGTLPALHVIHVVGVGHGLEPDAGRLGDALNAAFDSAARLGLRRIAMSPIGTERGVFSPEAAADALATVLGGRAAKGAPLPDSIVLVAGSAVELAAYRAVVNAVRPTTA